MRGPLLESDCSRVYLIATFESKVILVILDFRCNLHIIGNYCAK